MIIAAPEFLWLLITNQFEVDFSQIFQSEFEAKSHYKKETLYAICNHFYFPRDSKFLPHTIKNVI